MVQDPFLHDIVSLQGRHQNGDMYPLALDEILDETNQLDIGNKNKHWLATEVRIYYHTYFNPCQDE